jgi:ATP-dependent DNA helicase PIF1
MARRRPSRRAPEPRVEDHGAEPRFALTLCTPALVARLNYCDTASSAALDRMLRAAAHASRKRARSATAEQGPRDTEQGSDSDSDDEAGDFAARRRAAGGFLGIVKGHATSRPRGDASAEEPAAPEPEFLKVKHAWQDWRPFHVNEHRCPETARRFSVSESSLEPLSQEQKQAVFLIEAGLSCFVTGPGGTGKSELIRVIKQAAADAGVRVQLTASTGIAAKNIGGTTLHRFVGLGLMQGWSRGRAGGVMAAAREADPRVQRWANTDLLVVDEISMLSLETLRRMDEAARAARSRAGVGDDRKAFGGIQLVFLGDFAQLTMADDPDGAPASPSNFPFADTTWHSLVPFTVELRTIFRQTHAPFRQLLNRVRLGRALRGDIITLNTVASGTVATGDMPELCAYRATAAEVNAEHIATLLAAQSVEPVRYEPKGTDQAIEAAQTAGIEPIELCVGARVLLTKNIDPDRGLVNGSLGTVTGFVQAADAPGRSEVVAKAHKTAGATGAAGTTGAALVDAYERIPVVRWGTPGGDEPVLEEPLWPVIWNPTADEEDAQYVIYIPILCSWAITVHRAQGMTLAAAVIHAQSMKTPALLYTALSRIKSINGLRLKNQITETNIVANPEVVRYYDTLTQLIDSTAQPATDPAVPPLAVVPTQVLVEVLAAN